MGGVGVRRGTIRRFWGLGEYPSARGGKIGILSVPPLSSSFPQRCPELGVLLNLRDCQTVSGHCGQAVDLEAVVNFRFRSACILSFIAIAFEEQGFYRLSYTVTLYLSPPQIIYSFNRFTKLLLTTC